MKTITMHALRKRYGKDKRTKPRGLTTEAEGYRRFLPEDEYVTSFTARGETVPPFLVFQPFVIRNGVKGYMVPCKPDHPESEKETEQ